jgi:hypothetical protein
MTLDGIHLSLHDRRIKVVVDALLDDPESGTDAGMSEDTARRLATRVLGALDQPPRTTRAPQAEPIAASGTGPEDGDDDPDLDVLDLVTCPVCPHAVATHDAIGTRFCRVTATRALTRGCTCPARDNRPERQASSA